MLYTESENTTQSKKVKKLRRFEPPVIYSMFDPLHLAMLIEDVYNFHEVRYQLIKATVRDTYRVWGDERQFIFYVYRHQPRSKQEIGAEITWIEHLLQQGLPTARPIHTSHGDYLITLNASEGSRQAALFEFVAGQALSKKPTPQTAYRCGQLVAQLHKLKMPCPRA
jgi:Ser/Thr protein kinase RdoA (MazF antagonist)